MIPRKKQQFGGMIIALTGAGFSTWGWYTALYKGYFYNKAAMIFPAFCVLGLGLILFPGYKEERVLHGEDISRLKGMALLTLRWRVILFLALAAGGANYLMLLWLR